MISPLAYVDPSAKIGKNVTVHPFAYIDKNVEIGDDNVIMPYASLMSGTRMGNGNTVYQGAVVAATPQDFNYTGEETIARIGNKYRTDAEPWKVAKTDMDRTASILNVSLQICADLAIVFEPFLPFSAERLRHILNVDIKAGTDHRAGEEGTCGENIFKAGESAALHTVPCGESGHDGGGRPVLSLDEPRSGTHLP